MINKTRSKIHSIDISKRNSHSHATSCLYFIRLLLTLFRHLFSVEDVIRFMLNWFLERNTKLVYRYNSKKTKIRVLRISDHDRSIFSCLVIHQSRVILDINISSNPKVLIHERKEKSNSVILINNTIVLLLLSFLFLSLVFFFFSSYCGHIDWPQ